MSKIGIIVGIMADACSNYKLYPILKDMPDELFDLSNYMEEPASDVSIVYNLQKKYPNKTIDVLTMDDVNVKKFKEYDLIIGLYEATNVNLSQGYEAFKEYLSVIKSSKVPFYPKPEFIDFAANKCKWISHLKKHGLPVLDTIVFDNNKGKAYTNGILKKIKNKGWGRFITKPNISAYSDGFRIWDPKTTDKQFQKYVTANVKRDIGSKILAQRYVKEFHDFYEVRTYWINNTYKYAVGTIIDIDTLGGVRGESLDFNFPENEGGTLEMKLIRELKKVGKKALDCIPCDTSLIVRIDFGCCIENKNVCREYFINEIEYMPNLFCNEIEFPVIDMMSKNIIRLSNLKK